jgi:hypothetical protein
VRWKEIGTTVPLVESSNIQSNIFPWTLCLIFIFLSLLALSYIFNIKVKTRDAEEGFQNLEDQYESSKRYWIDKERQFKRKLIDENTGWVVGTNGVIRKTTNSGSTWTNQSTVVGLPDSSLRNVGVVWETIPISELVLSRGSYRFEGELVLPRGILNAFDRKALLELTVLPKAAPQDVQLISSSFRADAQRLFYDVSGLRVIDPVDDIHEVSLLGDGFDNRFFEIK